MSEKKKKLVPDGADGFLEVDDDSPSPDSQKPEAFEGAKVELDDPHHADKKRSHHKKKSDG